MCWGLRKSPTWTPEDQPEFQKTEKDSTPFEDDCCGAGKEKPSSTIVSRGSMDISDEGPVPCAPPYRPCTDQDESTYKTNDEDVAA